MKTELTAVVIGGMQLVAACAIGSLAMLSGDALWLLVATVHMTVGMILFCAAQR